MKTRKRVNFLITNIWESAGLDEKLEPSITELKQAYEEMRSVLDEYGNPEPEGDADEYDWEPFPPAQGGEGQEPIQEGEETQDGTLVETHEEITVETPEETVVENHDETNWKEKYEALKSRYIDIFMNGSQMTTPDEIIQEMEVDLNNEARPMGLDELLARADKEYLKQREKERRMHNA